MKRKGCNLTESIQMSSVNCDIKKNCDRKCTEEYQNRLLVAQSPSKDYLPRNYIRNTALVIKHQWVISWTCEMTLYMYNLNISAWIFFLSALHKGKSSLQISHAVQRHRWAAMTACPLGRPAQWVLDEDTSRWQAQEIIARSFARLWFPPNLPQEMI